MSLNLYNLLLSFSCFRSRTIKALDRLGFKNSGSKFSGYPTVRFINLKLTVYGQLLLFQLYDGIIKVCETPLISYLVSNIV
jgi:hypothetical protein